MFQNANDLRAKCVRKCVPNKCVCACSDVLLSRGFHVHIIYAYTHTVYIYFNHTMPLCCLRVMLMVLCKTGKELDIQEEKIRQILSELVCFRILLQDICRYKCIICTWEYTRETCLAIYIYECDMRAVCVRNVHALYLASDGYCIQCMCILKLCVLLKPGRRSCRQFKVYENYCQSHDKKESTAHTHVHVYTFLCTLNISHCT